MRPDLVFSTHMDTVPPYIPFSEDADFMYGRGVCDAKALSPPRSPPPRALRAEGFRVGLLFVSGEERDSAGAKVANESPKGSRFLINGEPTDNRLALASKGALRAVLRSTGKMAHSAYPELGDSAVHKLVEALAKLLRSICPSPKTWAPARSTSARSKAATRPTSLPTRPKPRFSFAWSATRRRCAPQS